MLPLHHGGATAEDASFVQKFIDSDLGTVVGTFLHTFGALLFTAGIALYIYQAHLVKSARIAKAVPSLHLLPYAHGFNLLGIAMNGLGGIMRLYQSDHPKIDQLGTSTWVQLLLAKHLFLVVGVGLAVFLTYRTHVLSLRDDAAQVFLGETRRMTTFAWTSFATILLASALGASATTQLVITPANQDPSGDMTDHAAMGHATSFVYDNDTGVITGSALMPGRETSEVGVREAGSQLYVELTWTNAQAATLDLEVRDPAGKAIAGKKTPAAGRVTWELAEAIAVGTWRVDVVSTQAVNERYHLMSRLTVGAALNGTILDETYTVNPKTVGASARFVELNLKMVQAKSFSYSWDVIDSDQKLDFNVHLHIGERVDYPVRGTWNSYQGTYTHNATGDGVSLMWENANAAPLRLHVRIVGEFGVDSRVVR
jgi:hypothetical protein